MSRRFDEVKSKILRHDERTQASGTGTYWHTAESLLDQGVIEPAELEVAHKTLKAIVLDGYFEYDDGRYYLKGHAPKHP